MKTQQQLIYQIYILLVLGVLVIVFPPLTDNSLFEKRILAKGTGLLLIWNGNALVIDKKENAGDKQDDTVLLPLTHIPLFFRPIPINDADFELLLTIPGVGPKLANEISITKKRLGGFKKEEDLLLINGVGRKKMQSLKNYFSFQ